MNRARVVALLFCGAAVVLAPWVGANLVRFERPVLLTTNDGTTLFGANCDDAYYGSGIGGWSLLCLIDEGAPPGEDPGVRSARQRRLAVSYAAHHVERLPLIVAARVGRGLDLVGIDNQVDGDVGEERYRWASWSGVVSWWVMAVLAALGVRRVAGPVRWVLLTPVDQRGDHDRPVLRRPPNPRADGACRRRLRRGRAGLDRRKAPRTHGGLGAMKPRIEYQPALDGVRAVAVAMVLLFHGGVGWMGGGYIGVSVFFTLSGYLITSLLLAESNATGSVRVGAFLARRARRLLPASVVCIVGVAVCSRYGLLDGVANLERDMLGAAFQVQNWVLLASGNSYTEVLARVSGQRSPLEHYWSLAIEEQFYWMWPAVFGWLATRHRDRLKRRLTGLTVAAMVAAPVIAIVWGRDAAYCATPARLAEILLGAWLAVTLAGRSLGGSWARIAPVALGALVLAAVLLPADGGLMYRGGLPLVGVASALLIAGLQAPGRLRRLLDARARSSAWAASAMASTSITGRST